MNYTLSAAEAYKNRIEAGTSILIQELHLCCKEENLQIEYIYQDTDTLTVEKSGDRIRISCKDTARYFRGLNWALHHLDEVTVQKTEQIYFPMQGFMLDCSRNAVFTVDKVKSILRLLARLGMTELMLYTEDTYEVPQEPYFGTYRGRFSKDEIREMDSYARIFGIELVPCVQTLAHLRNALKWPMGTELKDTNDILFVGKERVYEFIEELLVSLRDSFSTRRIHLGMDEAVQLGLGNYLKENGYRESSELIKEHCSRVLAICKKLGLEPMMWSDMYITANTGEEYYDKHSAEDTSGWIKPEKGLGLVYWDYYHEEEEHYQNMLTVHEQLSDSVTFAGGAWIWNGIAPNHSRTLLCTVPALKACRDHRIKEVFCTAWMDNGAETPVDAVFPGLVLFAHLGYYKELEQERFAEEFQNTVNGRLEDFWQLEQFDSLFVGTGNNITSDNPSKYLLYQDNLLGMFDWHIRELDTESYYGELAGRLEACAKTSPAYSLLFNYYRLLAEILSQKADLGVRIKDAYDKRDLSALERIAQEVIPALTKKVWEMKLLRERLWLRDAKPFGYELLDIRLGGVVIRLESNRRRLLSFLDGRTAVLEELEQPRLPYFPTDTSLHHGKEVSLAENQWHKIVSGCDLIDTI